jgi:hypothetical protein
MSESLAREAVACGSPIAWLEVRDDAIAWMAADRPEWRAVGGTQPGRPVLNRIINDTEIPKNVLYRLRDQQGSGTAASLDSDSLACIIAAAAKERGVSDEVAFTRIFKVVRARDLVEAAA